MEAEGSYTRIISLKHAPILTSKRLGYFEEKASAQRFFRCHHSHLISLEHINQLSKGKSGYVILTNDDTVPVSKAKKEDLHQLLGI